MTATPGLSKLMWLMYREAMDRWCGRGILALVLGILVFGPLALGAVRELEFAIIQGMTAGVLLLWGLRLWLNPRVQLLWPPVCWGVLAFTLYALARYLTADIEYVARQELLNILVYAFLFFAILNNLHRQETVHFISLTLIFLAMAISFYALYQFLSGSTRVWGFVSPNQHRGMGTYICPDHLGGFLEMLLPLALACTLTGRVKPLTRVLLGYAALVILVGIVVTVSRGSWLSTALTLLLFFGVLSLHHHYRLPALALLLVLVGAGIFFLPRSFHLERRTRALVTDEGRLDDSLRFALWKPACRMWRDHPWWGVGPAHYDYRFGQYRPEEVQARPDRVHNDYLNLLADYGVAGTVLIAAAWICLALGVARTWRHVHGSGQVLGRKEGSNRFAFVLGATLGLVAILAHSFVDFNLHIPANAILAVTLMALLSSHLRFATERYWISLRFGAKAFASIVLLAGLAYLAPQAWRQAAEHTWLARAANARSYSPEQIALLTKAFAVEPMNAQTCYAIGEAYRVESSVGEEDYQQMATQAKEWFGRSMKLNPWDGRSALRYGVCLDWLGRAAEANAYFNRADLLEPNNYLAAAYIGWHYVNLGDYAAARTWLERSLRLKWNDNFIAYSYLPLVQSRLLEAATNDLRAKLSGPPR